MSDFSSALDLSTSGLRAQAKRLRHVSENIANADTPGYRRKTVSFQSVALGSGAVEAGPVKLSQGALHKVFDPNHPLADATGHFSGSNVDLLVEITDAREAPTQL